MVVIIVVVVVVIIIHAGTWSFDPATDDPGTTGFGDPEIGVHADADDVVFGHGGHDDELIPRHWAIELQRMPARV